MSQDLESARDKVVRRVMRNISRRVVNAGPLPVRADDGTYPVVVTLPDETVGEMEERRNRIGRTVNVVVAYPDRMVVIGMRDADREDPAVIPLDTKMDDLVFYIRNSGDQVAAIRIGDPVKSDGNIEEFEYAF